MAQRGVVQGNIITLLEDNFERVAVPLHEDIMRFGEMYRAALPIERLTNDMRSIASNNRKKALSPHAA